MDINEARSKSFIAMTVAFAGLLAIVLLASGGDRSSRDTASAADVVEAQQPAGETGIVGTGSAAPTNE